MKNALQPNEIKAITSTFHKTVTVTCEDPVAAVYQVHLPFADLDGEGFYLWAFRHVERSKIILSDGRKMTTDIKQAGDLQLNAIKLLVNTYGLSLMDDLSIMELTDRPLQQRVTSFLQGIVALDGILRMWTQMKEQ